MSTSQTTHRVAGASWISPALWVLAIASVVSHFTAVLLHLPQAVGGAMLALSLLLFAARRVHLWMARHSVFYRRLPRHQ
jgi:hypothetical protein